ncbi:TIM barrel protein [Neobacillus niacini]|uniref:TIM barrel protein n=1 Tax=Neobacillus niacini TaxID=86668 RepID=UPI0039836DDB
MFKFANMNLIYQRYPLDYFLDSTVKLGMKAIELWAGAPHFYIPNTSHYEIQGIRKEIEKRDLELICFTPEQCLYPINLASLDQAIYKDSINYFKKSIDIANTLESPMILVSAGYGLFTENVQEVWKRSREALREIAEYAESQGVTLALEPFFYPYSNVVIDLNTTKEMLSEVNSPNLRAMVDLPCINVAGNTLEEYLTAFSGELAHIHFVDGDGKSSAHLAWGEGVYSADSLLNDLRVSHYDTYLTLELIGTQYFEVPEEAVKKSLQYLGFGTGA